MFKLGKHPTLTRLLSDFHFFLDQTQKSNRWLWDPLENSPFPFVPHIPNRVKQNGDDHASVLCA